MAEKLIVPVNKIALLPCVVHKKRVESYINILKSLFNITHFNFSRLHLRNGVFALYNGVEFSIPYWTNYCNTDFKAFIRQVIGNEYIVYVNELQNEEETEFLNMRQKNYGLPLGVIFIDYGDLYIDAFHFASNKLDDPISTIFKQTVGLKKFCRFFIKEFTDLIANKSNYIQLTEEQFIVLRHTFKQAAPTNLSKKVDTNMLDPIAKKFMQEELILNTNLRLTAAETRILHWAAKGVSAKQIAENCFVSSRTVEKHLQSIRNKFHCHKTSEVVVQARDCQLGGSTNFVA